MSKNLNVDIEGSFCYDNNPENCKKYGQLYTWEAAKKACPNGWHLPTDEEWKTLMDNMGGYYDFKQSKNIGDPAKAYQALIQDGNSNFAALLGGIRNSNGEFDYLSKYGFYWSASEQDADFAWNCIFASVNGKVNRYDYNKALGFSCRCLKD